MSNLIANLPSQKVWVRKEYLRDLKDGYGEFVEGYWISIKSIPGRAFYFETYLPEYGALYDKLPISAFVSRPETPSPDLSLSDLQYWNCMDYGVRVMEKQYVASMDWEIRKRNGGTLMGEYQFTIDNFHPDPDTIDYSTSENPQEHKSHNCIELGNGQFALYPNNRCRMYDLSLTPAEPKTPDFKVSTRWFQVEQGVDSGRYGDTDDYFWESPEEKDAFRHIEQVNKPVKKDYQGPLYAPHPDLKNDV